MPVLLCTAVQAQESAGNAAAAIEAIPDLAPVVSGPAPKRAWTFKPRVGFDVTRTDNARLAPVAEADTVTRLSPGVLIEAASARVKGRLDMRLDQLDYLQNKNNDNLQHALDGLATVELFEKQFFVDLFARINQQNISAFGTQSNGGLAANANQTETTTTGISPYLKGHLGNFAEYLVRYDHTSVSTATTSYNRSDTDTLQMNLNGLIQGTALGWQLNTYDSKSKYSNGFTYEMQTARTNISYKIDPQLKVYLIGGQEENNYQGSNNKATSIKGYGINWAPSPITNVDFSQEDRFFGNGHNLNLTHRTPLTTWRVSDRRDLQILPPPVSSGAVLTWNDYVNSVCAQFTNPVQHTNCINALLPRMDPATPYGNPGSLTTGANITRSQDASVTYTGSRNTVALLWQRSDSSKVGVSTGINDDFNLAPRIKQHNVTATWSNRLTHDSTLTLMQTWRTTIGSGASNNQHTDSENTTLTLTKKIGAYTDGSLGLRRATMTGTVSNYQERAVIGSLMFRF